MKKETRNLIEGSLIAAIYAALTLASYGISYGALQFRLSEALTVLPIFTPAGIWGLTVGCFIANIASFNSLDLVFGTAATLVSAFATYYFKDIKLFKIPIASIIMPIIFNSLIIGAELSVLSGTGLGFLASVLTVGMGEAVVCLGLGIPLYLIIEKYNKRGNL